MLDYLTKLFGLQGKVAAFTGAGGFLVSEMSRGLAKAGVKVALLDNNLEAARNVMNEICADGGKAIAVEMDVTEKRDFQRALDTILNEFGDLDFAVFGANLNAPAPFLEITLEEGHAILDVLQSGCGALKVGLVKVE